jgi:hypothetical protein
MSRRAKGPKLDCNKWIIVPSGPCDACDEIAGMSRTAAETKRKVYTTHYHCAWPGCPFQCHEKARAISHQKRHMEPSSTSQGTKRQWEGELKMATSCAKRCANAFHPLQMRTTRLWLQVTNATKREQRTWLLSLICCLQETLQLPSRERAQQTSGRTLPMLSRQAAWHKSALQCTTV